MNGINNSFTSIEQVTSQYLNQPKEVQNKNQTADGFSFEQVLKNKFVQTGELKFSKHATQRLDDRGINISQDISSRLEEGVQKANQKGIKDSLVIVDSLAFIVNVPNNTVVTALDKDESVGNVFTNIDGAVIA